MGWWTGKWVYGLMGGWVDGWVDGWMDGRMYGWMVGWMDGWVSGLVDGSDCTWGMEVLQTWLLRWHSMSVSCVSGFPLLCLIAFLSLHLSGCLCMSYCLFLSVWLLYVCLAVCLCLSSNDRSKILDWFLMTFAELCIFLCSYNSLQFAIVVQLLAVGMGWVLDAMGSHPNSRWGSTETSPQIQLAFQTDTSWHHRLVQVVGVAGTWCHTTRAPRCRRCPQITWHLNTKDRGWCQVILRKSRS